MDQFIPRISMLKICNSPLIGPHNAISTNLSLDQISRKIREIFLMFITSQIVNSKMIEYVFVLRKCYQCSGETRSRDSTSSISTRTRSRYRYSTLDENFIPSLVGHQYFTKK
jgi:hypothetical protein